jgi:hypothetical protein
MESYEKLGLFYLGRRYDIERSTRLEDPVLYESRDLVTHAVCVGMTGSGKTGLGIALIEEAAIDRVPVLAIDPKGDLANLLLTFPDLNPADFAPWVDPADAAARGVTADALATQLAQQWRAGLAEWNQPPDRIARLKAAADVRVYTPGSRIGTPLALLDSLSVSPDDDSEDAAARIATTAASLLALAGITDAAPHSRELTLLSAILGQSAGAGRTDLGWLVQQIQRPSFARIGVLDVDTFYPPGDRQELALRFNSVLAAPGFDVWMSGEPLDPARLLFTPDGKPRVAIVSIAHLDEAKRMMVVSLLLNAVLDWTRRQSGTASLRALVYMDEVFGYLPPVANPPSKLPLLTLLKQARAFGVGVMLATQNPVDLDYKALSNIGTWFLGKLQTERDKARVLDGLEGVAGAMDRATLDRTLSALRSRVFLMHNVHDTEPTVFETRWTLSYLRGPIGREELRRIARPQRAAPTAGKETGLASAVGDASPVSSRASDKPVLPAGIHEVFLGGDGVAAEYEPVLYAAARVHYADARRGLDVTADVMVTVPFTDGPIAIDWDRATDSAEPPERLTTTAPASAAGYRQPPADALKPKRYAEWSRDFEQWIVRSRPLRLLSAPALKVTSQPGENERDFRARLQQASRESRDAALDALRGKYAPKIARLTERVRKATESVDREQQQAQQQKLQTAVSFGATLLGAMMGRRSVSMSTLGRATTAARGVSRSMKEADDVARAGDRLAQAQEELRALQATLDEEVAALSATEPATASLESAAISARRGAVDVRLIALAWQPLHPR